MVPIDTVKTLEDGRGMTLTVAKEHRYRGLNWDALREKVKKGMRNATLMATAPNANIGLVAGTTPGIDPRFAQVFSRNKISGKYLDLNHNLVNDLKNMGIWEKVKDQIIAEQGDISAIDEIPQHIRDIYKTSFSTSPYAFIEVAARAQKWMDQSLSRNMYLETRDIGEMMDIYATAWKKGLKSTYYLHMKPRHTAEQSDGARKQSGADGQARIRRGDGSGGGSARGGVSADHDVTADHRRGSHRGKRTSRRDSECHSRHGGIRLYGNDDTGDNHRKSDDVHAGRNNPGKGRFRPVRRSQSRKPCRPVHTTKSAEPSHAPSAFPAATTSASSNAPRIMPPSDPMEQFLCDSCQ